MMSESAKWQVYGQMGAGWFVGGTDPATPTSEEIDGFLCLGPAGAEMAAEFLNSLETSLVEAQKERDAYRESILHVFTHAVAKSADAVLIAQKEYTAQQLHEWTLGAVDAVANRAEAAEQQLAEVKAQLDAQAGVIRELAEALGKIDAERTDYVPEPEPYDHSGALEYTYAEAVNHLADIAAAALAHVREPETK